MTNNPLRDARLAAKLTVKDTAAMLHVPKRTYEEWEAGRRNPKKGRENIAELIKAFGIFTEGGKESIKEGLLTEKEILNEYRIAEAQRISKWGRYPTTWSRAFDRIQDCLYPKLQAEDIAALVDAFVECYSDGKGNR